MSLVSALRTDGQSLVLCRESIGSQFLLHCPEAISSCRHMSFFFFNPPRMMEVILVASVLDYPAKIAHNTASYGLPLMDRPVLGGLGSIRKHGGAHLF